MEQVGGQVKEIKKLVVANQDTLLALHTNRDKPEIFSEVLRKLKSKAVISLVVAMQSLILILVMGRGEGGTT